MSTQLVSAPAPSVPALADSGMPALPAPLPITSNDMLARVTHTELSFESRRAQRQSDRARGHQHRSTFVAPRHQVVLAWVATLSLALAGGAMAAAILVLI